MPFTLATVRLIGVLLIVALDFFVLGASSISGLVVQAAIWLTLIGLPVLLIESLGFLSGAAEFFFGKRH
jgi:hypothetical protein